MRGDGYIDARGYRRISRKQEHVIIAERALGCPLPTGAVVHHMDGGKENRSGNIAILQDQTTHLIIHQRMRAKAACGNADWRKCPFCKRYDDPANLKEAQPRHFYHHSCYLIDQKQRREARRGPVAS